VGFRRWALQIDRKALDLAIWDATSEQSECLPFLLEASRLTETKLEDLLSTSNHFDFHSDDCRMERVPSQSGREELVADEKRDGKMWNVKAAHFVPAGFPSPVDTITLDSSLSPSNSPQLSSPSNSLSSSPSPSQFTSSLLASAAGISSSPLSSSSSSSSSHPLNARDSDELFYFYQLEDGQQVYLHPLNTRMLHHGIVGK
jgi:hypothetical protein